MKIYLTDLRDIVKCPNALKRFQECLSPEEQQRFEGMTHENRKLQFLIGRALVQDICQQSPVLLPSGKPIIQNGFISLAHSGPYVVLAVSDSPVGIDIEDTSQNKDFSRLARRLNFTLAENKRDSFYRQFTHVESLYKLGEHSGSIRSFYYSINTFVLCITTLNNKEKINIIKKIPFENGISLSLPLLATEVSDDL